MGEIIKELHKYLCWLDQIPEIGRKARFSLLQVAAAQNLFSDGIETGESLASGARVLYDASERQLTWLCGEAFPAGEKARKMVQLLTRAKNREPARVEEELFHAEIRFSCILEEDFPRRLRRIPDPPFGIYAKGRLPEQEPVRDIRDRESPIRPDPETVCPAGEGGNGDDLRGSAGEGRNGDGLFGPAGEGRNGDGLCGPAGEGRNGDGLFGPVGEGGNGDGLCGPAGEGGSENSLRGAAGFPEPAAAVIGARLASGYGREQARRFGRCLGARGVTVISGMARGIDGIAQRAALDAGGRSFAVLGCGVDICYPEENRDLYERLIQEGGVLSEYAPGMPPEARMFPPRNRIISGLSDLVLVIEARKKSGTLITVDMALEQGREVFAIPGRVSDPLSDGCNRLIRQGAGIATCPDDILQFFFGTGKTRETGEVPENMHASSGNADGQSRDGDPGSRADDPVPVSSESDIRKRREKRDDQENAEKSNRNPLEEKSAVYSAPRGSEKGNCFEESVRGRKNCLPGENEPEHADCFSRKKEQHCAEQSCGDSARDCPERAEGRRKNGETDLPAGPRGRNRGPASGEDCGEEEQEEEPASLEALILRILSSEEETHLERILQDVRKYADDGRLSFGTSDFPAVNACLLALRIEGRVEEPLTGYFRKAASRFAGQDRRKVKWKSP